MTVKRFNLTVNLSNWCTIQVSYVTIVNKVKWCCLKHLGNGFLKYLTFLLILIIIECNHSIIRRCMQYTYQHFSVLSLHYALNSTLLSVRVYFHVHLCLHCLHYYPTALEHNQHFHWKLPNVMVRIHCWCNNLDHHHVSITSLVV